MTTKAETPTEKEFQEWYQIFLGLVDDLRKKSAGGLIGKYFVIRDGDIVGQYDTFDTAYRSCIEQYKDNRFLIQQLLPEDASEFIFVTA